MIDNVTPKDKWEFDGDVTAAFENMLERSIPEYKVMRQTVHDLACAFITKHTAVIDLGSSRGDAVAQLIDTYANMNRFYLTDVSEPMLDHLKDRFAHYIVMNSVVVQNQDLRTEFPLADASVILSILTLQFTPIEYRQQIVQRVYDHLLPGGAFILVEKVLGASANLDGLFVDTYYRMKRENGYTQEQIDRKRMSLEGVLVPVTARWNQELLHSAGFRQVDTFWRWCNFAGWIGVKD